MEFLRINNMIQPTDSWVIQFLDWLKENTIGFIIFALGWKGVDRFFAYQSKTHENKINELLDKKITERVTPDINKLTHSIDELKEAIWSLKK